MGKGIEMETFFRALADRTRLRLLNLLGDDEVCVCFLVEILKTSQPNVSRHLAYLRRAGIVGARRDGKWIHYRIVIPEDQHAARALEDVRSWLARDQEMQRDRKRLARACCGSTLPVQLQAAPKPKVSVHL
jgi:ArsR family transcriptional regulator, arsenate/arsenite/antimonite-responsive transcriptional repressor